MERRWENKALKATGALKPMSNAEVTAVLVQFEEDLAAKGHSKFTAVALHLAESNENREYEIIELTTAVANLMAWADIYDYEHDSPEGAQFRKEYSHAAEIVNHVAVRRLGKEIPLIPKNRDTAFKVGMKVARKDFPSSGVILSADEDDIFLLIQWDDSSSKMLIFNTEVKAL